MIAQVIVIALDSIIQHASATLPLLVRGGPFSYPITILLQYSVAETDGLFHRVEIAISTSEVHCLPHDNG
jgi:hypothetical protein